MCSQGPEGWWPLRKTVGTAAGGGGGRGRPRGSPGWLAATASVTGVRSVAPAGVGPTRTHVTDQFVVFLPASTWAVSPVCRAQNKFPGFSRPGVFSGLCVSACFLSRYKVATNIDPLHRIDFPPIMKESCKLQLLHFKGLEKPSLICCIRFQINRLKCQQNKIELLNIISRFQMVTTPKRYV